MAASSKFRCVIRVSAPVSAVAAFVFLAASLLGATVASAACPNEVFRTGPSAKLPDCRAYELVSPPYTGGLAITFDNGPVSELPSPGESELIAPGGNDVLFQTTSGSLPGTPGMGDVDRYRAKRTADGWVTELVSLHGDQADGGRPSASSPDHNYFFQSATNPTANLWAPWVGRSKVEMLRTPAGFEPLARGSLGDDTGFDPGFDAYNGGKLITDNGTHVFFVSAKHLEPLAAPEGTYSIYDRTPGSTTSNVVSLPPGNQQTTEEARWLGATKDGSEVAFELGGSSQEEEHGWGEYPIYIRRNGSTQEAVRPEGVVVGKKLHCTGEPETSTLAYQWLRDGAPIGGATSSDYTVAAADEGAVLQCQVTASDAEGASVTTSLTRLVEPYRETETPELHRSTGPSIGPAGAQTVGTELTCESGEFGVAGATYTHAWLREGTVIAGATAEKYTPVEADAGHSLQCRETASTGSGTAVAYSGTVAITPVYPTASIGPGISASGSTVEKGDELFCSKGTWSDSPTFAYQWLRNGTEIGGAASSTYTVVAADEGTVLQCVVTAANAAATTKAASDSVVVEPQPGTAPPQITFESSIIGQPTVGESLYCNGPGWSGEPAVSRQWVRNGSPIAGETEFSYTLTAADLGKVVQCRLAATNAGGTTVALDGLVGAPYVTKAVPRAAASMPAPTLAYAGIFNGHLFYADRYTSLCCGPYYAQPADLYSYDVATGRSTAITHTGDAAFVNVSEDGSHVYFVHDFNVGEEEAGKLFVWNRADESTTEIAELSAEDIESFASGGAGLATWDRAVGPHKESKVGRGLNHTHSTTDGSVLVFEATTPLTSFDNTEATPESCTKQEENKADLELCEEIYRYDADTGQLTCVSCGPGSGPATGEAELTRYDNSFTKTEPATVLSLINNLSDDGNSIFFESTEALVPRDINHARDVYRWQAGKGVALISSGQSLNDSALYAASRDGSDVLFVTRQQLLPQDENGTAIRLYDARVNGGFPPPESTVTEPCAGDVCQGAPSAAAAQPQIASSALNGVGNVQPKLRCAKSKRRVVRHGKERCVKRHHRRHKHHHRHRRGGANRRSVR